MSNTDWKDETVQELKKGYMAMITDRDEHISTLLAEVARLTKENKWRKRDSEHLMELGEKYKLLEAEVARLTAGSEAMQEDARNNTATIKAQAEEIHTIKTAIEDIKIYCNNPSAWEHYDDGVSEKIRAILKAAGMA